MIIIFESVDEEKKFNKIMDSDDKDISSLVGVTICNDEFKEIVMLLINSELNGLSETLYASGDEYLSSDFKYTNKVMKMILDKVYRW